MKIGFTESIVMRTSPEKAFAYLEIQPLRRPWTLP